MSRRSRIELVGKLEAREIEARADELRELRWTLRREWHEGTTAQEDLRGTNRCLTAITEEVYAAP